MTKRRVILDPNHDPSHRTRTIERQLQESYNTRNLETAMDTLERYQVDYIVVFPDMFLGKELVRQDEGLLFLLHNSKNFKRIYEKDGIEIWHVLY